MKWSTKSLGAALLAQGLATGCGAAVHADGPAVLRRAGPFSLAGLLEEATRASGSRRVGLELTVLDSTRQPLPFALLELAWVEGGRMALQTDESARLGLRFDLDADPGEATVSCRVLSSGHAFTSEFEDAARALADFELRIEVAAAP